MNTEESITGKRRLPGDPSAAGRWLGLALLLMQSMLPTNAVGTISPPATIEVTANAGQSRLGPIRGGVCMAKSGVYYVAAGAGNGLNPTVRAWKNNDTVKWTWSPGSGAANDLLLVPVLDSAGANLYVCTDGGTVYCLDALTDDPLPSGLSRVRWQAALGSYQTTIRSAPALNKAGTALYVHTVGSNAKLHALNPSNNGAELWASSATGNPGCAENDWHNGNMVMASGPVVAANGNIYVGTSAGTIQGFDANGNLVLNVNLNSRLGETGIQIEAAPALGLNGWLYVGTRAYNHAVTGSLGADLVAIDPTAPSGPLQVRWRQVIATHEGTTPGILVSPILDRAGYVYATEFGHVIQQHDAVYGTLTRSWGLNVLPGKLCQTPALTEDGLLLVGTSNWATQCGHAKMYAIRSLGNDNDNPLWEA